MVNTEGHLLAALVYAADINDREGARWIIAYAHGQWTALQKLWADQGYTGDLVGWLQQEFGIDLGIVAKAPEQEGFAVLPRRWVVERSIAWYGRARRLGKDYEHLAEYSESWIYLASIMFLLQRLHPSADRAPPYARKAA